MATSTTVASVEADVEAAYRAFWDDFRAAADPMDPASARLPAHATGRQLSFLRQRFTRLRAEGLVIRGTIDLAVDVTSVDGDHAVLEDCHDDSNLLQYDAKTGELRDTVDPRRSLFRVDMQRTSEGWKVEFADEIEERKGCEPSG